MKGTDMTATDLTGTDITGKKRKILLVAVALGVLALAGCKKDAGNTREIELPEGQIHVGTQWVDGELWIETLDPKTATCTFSQYKDGVAVEATAITLKHCKTSMSMPMMRPSMQQGMQSRPGLMQRPGMMSRGPAQHQEQPASAPAASAAPAETPPAAEAPATTQP